MADPFDGRLIFPGGQRELKSLKKEMKKLRSNWVADVNWKYRRQIKMSANQWADLADDAVEILIASDTQATLAFIAGLGQYRIQEDVYSHLIEASRVMARYGISLYQPGGNGTRNPGRFEEEAEALLAQYNPQAEAPEPEATTSLPEPREKALLAGEAEDQPPTEDHTSQENSELSPGEAADSFCTECGRRYAEEDRFCGTCGKPRQEEV